MLLKDMIQLDILDYLKYVYVNVIIVTIFSVFAPLLFNMFAADNFVSFILSLFLTLIWTSLVIFFVGCKKEERVFIKNKLILVLSKF